MRTPLTEDLVRLLKSKQTFFLEFRNTFVVAQNFMLTKGQNTFTYFAKLIITYQKRDVGKTV